MVIDRPFLNKNLRDVPSLLSCPSGSGPNDLGICSPKRIQENRQWSIPLVERGAIHYPPFSLLSTFSSNLWCLKENLLSTFRFSFFHCVPHHASFNFPFWQQSLVKTKNLCEILLLKRPTVNLPFLKKKRQARLKKLDLWSNYYISGNELYRDQGWTEYLGKELLTQ